MDLKNAMENFHQVIYHLYVIILFHDLTPNKAALGAALLWMGW
jgi:hypothetical protein